MNDQTAEATLIDTIERALRIYKESITEYVEFPPETKRDAIITYTIKEHEGGYVAYNPNTKDPETNYGITKPTLQAYYAEMGWGPVKPDDMRHLPLSMAVDIYRTKYWPPVAKFPEWAWHITFDMHVQHRAWVKLLQDAASIYWIYIIPQKDWPEDFEPSEPDNDLGQKTLDSFHLASYPDKLLRRVIDRRWEYYEWLMERRPALQVYSNGWHKRCYSFSLDTYQAPWTIAKYLP